MDSMKTLSKYLPLVIAYAVLTACVAVKAKNADHISGDQLTIYQKHDADVQLVAYVANDLYTRAAQTHDEALMKGVQNLANLAIKDPAAEEQKIREKVCPLAGLAVDQCNINAQTGLISKVVAPPAAAQNPAPASPAPAAPNVTKKP